MVADADSRSTVWSILPRFSGLEIKGGDNLFSSSVSAKIVGSTIVTTTDVVVRATDRPVALAVVNAFTIGQKGLFGIVAVGVAMPTNKIDDTVTAAIETSTVTAGGDILLMPSRRRSPSPSEPAR